MFKLGSSQTANYFWCQAAVFRNDLNRFIEFGLGKLTERKFLGKGCDDVFIYLSIFVMFGHFYEIRMKK